MPNYRENEMLRTPSDLNKFVGAFGVPMVSLSLIPISNSTHHTVSDVILNISLKIVYKINHNSPLCNYFKAKILVIKQCKLILKLWDTGLIKH